MNRTFSVRTARDTDAHAIYELDQLVFAAPDQFSRRRFRYLLRSSHAFTLVAERQGEIVGCVVTLIRRASSGVTTGRIYSIAVAPDARNAGLGTELLNRAEGELRRRRAVRVTLETRVNSSQQAFFFKRGYEPGALLLRYYYDANGIRMSKSLIAVAAQA